jgi:hypothetical protein
VHAVDILVKQKPPYPQAVHLGSSVRHKAGGLSLRSERNAARTAPYNETLPEPLYRELVFDQGFASAENSSFKFHPSFKRVIQAQQPREKRCLPYWPTAYSSLIKINNRTAYCNYSYHAANPLPTARIAHSKVLLIFARACL